MGDIGTTDHIRSDEPTERLTRICAAMTDVLDAHPERTDDVKCIVFLQDGDRGGLQLHGYENDGEAIADLMVHIKAIFESNGKSFAVMAGDSIETAERVV